MQTLRSCTENKKITIQVFHFLISLCDPLIIFVLSLDHKLQWMTPQIAPLRIDAPTKHHEPSPDLKASLVHLWFILTACGAHGFRGVIRLFFCHAALRCTFQSLLWHLLEQRAVSRHPPQSELAELPQSGQGRGKGEDIIVMRKRLKPSTFNLRSN
jgi:hypothetical protein